MKAFSFLKSFWNCEPLSFVETYGRLAAYGLSDESDGDAAQMDIVTGGSKANASGSISITDTISSWQRDSPLKSIPPGFSKAYQKHVQQVAKKVSRIKPLITSLNHPLSKGGHALPTPVRNQPI